MKLNSLIIIYKDMSYSEYKYYISDSLHGVVSKDHVKELKNRIKMGVNTTDEVYNAYNYLFNEKNGYELMSYKVWYRNKRLSYILNKKSNFS